MFTAKELEEFGLPCYCYLHGSVTRPVSLDLLGHPTKGRRLQSKMVLRLPRSVSRHARSGIASFTLTSFLYPPASAAQLKARGSNFFGAVPGSLTHPCHRNLWCTAALGNPPPIKDEVSVQTPSEEVFEEEYLVSVQQPHHPHSEYSTSPFTDLRALTLSAGSGGHGCVSFLREKFVSNGPANGGDGGSGGSVYIQAVYGETSLHKIARDGAVQATAGRNGQGSAINGKRGDDVVIRVPVGTVVREISRWDRESEELGWENAHDENITKQGEGEEEGAKRKHGENDNWLHYPRSLSQNLQSPQFTEAPFPFHHHRSSSEILAQTHPTPVYLDLSEPTMQPILLLPGAPGGFGNPHFVSNELRQPKFATKGGKGARMKVQLELKILADVGLVGLPNAGKSSFLRSVSGKQARVGEWAFTTLSPNIGTIVLDERVMAPQGRVEAWEHQQHPRFTIADIPGLISDAHLNKGLGHGFLRHVERAKVLGFVLDLSRDDPVADLEGLWREVRAYEQGEDGGDGGIVKGMMSEMAGNTNVDDVAPMEELGCNEGGVEVLEDGEGEKEPEKAVVAGDEGNIEEENSEELVRFLGVAAFVPRREAPQLPKRPVTRRFELESPHPRQEQPRMSSKPWFVIANKADLPGTEEKYWALKQHLEGEAKKRSDLKEIGLLPISALRGQGVDKVVDWMKGMLGF